MMKQTSESINCSQQSPCFFPGSCPRFFENGDQVIKNKYYQVFVNFRGVELRKHFVSHLLEALGSNKINFFIDANEQRGKDLQNLFVRIQESKIALAIFSPRYSESKWCMDELVKMKELAVEEKLIVIPIFYKVRARDVKNPNIDSEFSRNFKKLIETSKDMNEIKKWAQALEYISNKTGVCLSDASSEAQLVKDIVKAVKRVVKTRHFFEEYVVNTIKGFVAVRST